MVTKIYHFSDEFEYVLINSNFINRFSQVERIDIVVISELLVNTRTIQQRLVNSPACVSGSRIAPSAVVHRRGYRNVFGATARTVEQRTVAQTAQLHRQCRFQLRGLKSTGGAASSQDLPEDFPA